ncbi:MAG: triose-phosphate isomerase, partial [Coriobacteriia bacterium]|nr:triose-phosphate isomerase [Coriobacteriia bacterium]
MVKSRMPLIAGNWKMNLTAAQGVSLIQNIDDYLSNREGGSVEVVVAPAFTAIHSASTVIDLDKLSIGLGAQNMFWEDSGAFTGEVSPTMLTASGVSYVILGHSERREHFGETDEMINRKLKAAIRNKIKPILCCGESLETREEEETLPFIEAQIRAGLTGLSRTTVTGLTIAYEPIW